jgi:outer membrane lipoprotein-sorting protein
MNKNNLLRSRGRGFTLALVVCGALFAGVARAEDATAIVKAAIDYWRGTSSYSVVQMTIHRPDWQRTMLMRVWTRGAKDSLVRVLEPAKDAGSGTLLLGDNMWTFAPEINRVIKIPSSMMQQSWMGSDFSNNDIAKSDDIVDEYTHKILSTENKDGHKVYVIESIPKETAPVVWGKEVIRVRDDHLLLQHDFYDQDMKLVKSLRTLEIKPMGGRNVASIERMQKVDKPNEWTEVTVKEAKFSLDIPSSTFTLSNLRNPR